MLPRIIDFFDRLSSGGFHDFLRLHENDDVRELALSQRDVLGVPAKYVAQQVGGRQKIKNKLPSWWRQLDVLYPPTLNLEQSSSEITARFKRDLLREKLKKKEKGADLTGGFGVDACFLSECVDHLDY